jgi:hypothetical protein
MYFFLLVVCASRRVQALPGSSSAGADAEKL